MEPKIMTKEDCRQKFRQLRCCVLIPTYNNAGTLSSVINEVLEYSDSVIVVNDGCTDTTPDIISSFGDRIRSLTHEKNSGKGVAIMNGFAYASRLGFTHVVTIDADGQHFPSDLPLFAEAMSSFPDAIIVGARDLQADGMPGKNTFANKFSNFWFKLETGIRLEDTQSGFRAYPLGHVDFTSRLFTGGYEFELEVLVFSAWKGTQVRNIPVHVYYPPEGERVSHFKPFRDFTKISILNTILVFYCLFWRWPMSFFRKLTWANIKKFIDKNIIHSGESNLRIASAIGFGVFMGLMPIWGYQMICALALAHLMKLNKVITLVAANISLPPLIPFIVFGGYWTGCKLLSQPVRVSFAHFDLASAGEMMLQYVLGSLVFGLVVAAVFWVLSMLLLAVFRRDVPRP